MSAFRYVCDNVTAHGPGPVKFEIPPGQERFEVKGFEAEREGGGTNHLELRQRTGVVWCSQCVEAAKLKRQHGGVPGRLEL